MRKFIEVLRAVTWLVVMVSIVFAFTTPAKAHEPVSVTFGGISYHMLSENTTTWFHSAAIMEYGNYMGGYLRNSYGQDSWVVGYRVWENHQRKFSGKLYFGAVKGYDTCYAPFSEKERKSGKEKVAACFLPVYTMTFKTDTVIKPQLSIWGDAIVLTGNYTF